MDATPTSQGTDPEPAAEPATSTEARLDDLETHQQTIDEKIDQILGLVRGKGRPSEPAGPQGGAASGDSHTAASVAEQVQAELARERKAAKDQAAADADKTERETLRERLARLEEQPPVPPVRRATKLLGWGSGR